MPTSNLNLSFFNRSTAQSQQPLSHITHYCFSTRPLSPFSTQRYHQRIFHSERHTLGVVTLMQWTVHKTFVRIRSTTSMYGEVPHMVESLRSLSLTSVKSERRPQVELLTSDGNIRSCVTTNPWCAFCFVTERGSIKRSSHAWPHLRNQKISTHYHVTWAEMKIKIRKLG